VFVVVVAVRRVPAAVVHVVDVILVRDRHMATSLAVHMVMTFMHRVAGRLAFVVVTLVLPMNVTVVYVVDVIPVRDRNVPASFAMFVSVFEVLVVDCAGHFLHRPYRFDLCAAGATRVRLARCSWAVEGIRAAVGRSSPGC
jgi:hypothetical protein